MLPKNLSKESQLIISPIIEQYERWQQSTIPVDCEQIKRGITAAQERHKEMSRIIDTVIQPQLQMRGMLAANDHCFELAKQAMDSKPIFDDLSKVHATWYGNLAPDILDIKSTVNLVLCETVGQITAAESLLACIDFSAISRALSIPEAATDALKLSVNNAISSYESLAASINDYSDLTCLPAFVLPGAAHEVLTTARLLDALQSPEEQDVEKEEKTIAIEEEAPDCLALLQKVDSHLGRAYLGANEAINSNNPDKTRHVMISIRELCVYLLEKLAPDDHVLEWVPENQTDLLRTIKKKNREETKKPTYRARVYYVCRDFNHGPFSDFVDKNTKVFLDLIEDCNRIHNINIARTDEQLHMLMKKTDSWLTFILNIWQTGVDI